MGRRGPPRQDNARKRAPRSVRLRLWPEEVDGIDAHRLPGESRAAFFYRLAALAGVPMRGGEGEE